MSEFKKGDIVQFRDRRRKLVERHVIVDECNDGSDIYSVYDLQTGNPSFLQVHRVDGWTFKKLAKTDALIQEVKSIMENHLADRCKFHNDIHSAI